MYIIVAIIIILLILLGFFAIYNVFKTKINFFITGLDSGFTISDLLLLWDVATLCDLKEPVHIFYSMPVLTTCMTQLSNSLQSGETQNSPRIQLILSKLFDYRTKLQNKSDDKKGLTSTRTLAKDQKLRIILPGKGVFVSEIINNGNQIVISVPRKNNQIVYSGEDWVGKVVSIYLWRKGDARYVFDTTVVQSGYFLGKAAIFLKHSNNLVRTQKRKSVRIQCKIYAQMYIITQKVTDYSVIETKNGYKCLIEDISESGALIRIGGKGKENIQIKLQYNIGTSLIVMFGIIRTAEYNEELNQSLLHFECTHIENSMRNEVLKFVYNILPDNEKEILEALSQTDDDIDEEDKNIIEGSSTEESQTTDNQDFSPEELLEPLVEDNIDE